MRRNGKSSPPADILTRIPPQDLDAERAVIGSLLVSEPAVSTVAEILSAEDFYSENHRILFRAAMALYAKSEPVDQLTLINELKAQGELEKCGGRSNIMQLVESVPLAANVRRYAEIVQGKALLRRVIDASLRIQEEAFGEPEDPTEALDRAEQLVYEVSNNRRDRNAILSLEDVSDPVLERIQALYSGEIASSGIPSGLVDLDEITSGFYENDLTILAARPAMGKTALAMDILWHVARHLGKAAAIFSLEMSKEQLTHRLLSRISGIPTSQLRSGQVPDDSWPRLVRAHTELRQASLFIDDTSDTSVGSMRAKLRRLTNQLKHRDRELGLVVVDYIGLMLASDKPGNREQEISEISRGLKKLARDLQVPVIALSQLNRGVEQRHDKRPLLSDLRDSGAVEQDADLVLFIYRDEYYTKGDSEFPGQAEIIVAKHRQGDIGTARVKWIPKEVRFANLARGPVWIEE